MEDINIAIIGLGYVGLPLAVAFAKKFKVKGFDINKSRISELEKDLDTTLEVSTTLLKERKGNLYFTSEIDELNNCNFYVITVPTPIDKYKRPDLTPLINASNTLSKIIKKGDTIVFESTVYPGATEEVCVPIMEKGSGLKFNQDFYCGYSPERINPGDKLHTVEKILKVTSGSTPEIARYVDKIYSSIITAGTYMASSIKVAEAAKVIENSQRDINIAFVNELAKIFNLLDIDTNEVIKAASTKWNFLPFKPGLVGGHCIGVDPYYLAEKAKEVGYNPEIILSGRRINDGMAKYVASQVIKLMIRKNGINTNSKALILGVTFKENCPDIRNSQVIHLIKELQGYNIKTEVCDPWANSDQVEKEYNLKLIEQNNISFNDYNCIVLAVPHDNFKSINYNKIDTNKTVVYDIKSFLPTDIIDSKL